MIAEEETNKETITVLTTDQIIDQTMVLNKETIDRTTDQTIDQTTDQDLIMALTTDQDPTTDRDRTMDQDRIMDHPTDPLTDLTTDQQVHLQIN